MKWKEDEMDEEDGDKWRRMEMDEEYEMDEEDGDEWVRVKVELGLGFRDRV